MKKIIVLLFISMFIFTGCTKTNKKEEIQKSTYIKDVQKLKKVKESSSNLPFTIEVKYDKVKDELRYQVIIDNPTKEIKSVKALAVHNKQTDDVFPSVGIFDKKVDLIPNKKPSGVILVGYVPYEKDIDMKIKVMISYKIDNETYTSYYVTKK